VAGEEVDAMNARTGMRGLVAGLTLVLLPAGALAHEIVPWGVYPSAGDVVIATKAKRLLDRTFLGQILTVALVPFDPGTVYEAQVGTGLPPVSGDVSFVNPKGTKAKLTVDANTLALWGAYVADLLRAYREAHGDVVQDVTVTPKTAGGTATFKTKPTPIGPNHKASVSVTVKFRAVVTLAGGKTRKGIVTMAVTSKGIRLGFPGD
jgi:hypothetical protein